MSWRVHTSHWRCTLQQLDETHRARARSARRDTANEVPLYQVQPPGAEKPTLMQVDDKGQPLTWDEYLQARHIWANVSPGLRLSPRCIYLCTLIFEQAESAVCTRSCCRCRRRCDLLW